MRERKEFKKVSLKEPCGGVRNDYWKSLTRRNMRGRIRGEGREEGKKEGREEGIRGTVSVLKELGVPQQTILSQIQKQYNLSLETSKNIYRNQSL